MTALRSSGAKVWAILATVASCGGGDASDERPTALAGETGFLDGRTISVGGADRTYSLFVPGSASGKLPLVFVFHGDGGKGAGIRKSYAIEAAANGAAIFVYPDGRNASWDLDDKADANPDIALFDALVTELEKSYPIDAARIFATGYSSGGYFANQLGCRRGSVLRAVASHEAGGPYGADDEYDENGDLVCPESPVASLAVHGTSDPEVDISEGEKTRDHWRRVDGCSDQSEPYDPSPCVKYTGCAPERPVVWCAVPGFGHVVWPDEGAKVAWSFFAAL